MTDKLLLMGMGFCIGVLALTALAVLLAGDGLHCQEDEVAIHGGLRGWYDPAAELECVHIDDFDYLRGVGEILPVVGDALCITPSGEDCY